MTPSINESSYDIIDQKETLKDRIKIQSSDTFILFNSSYKEANQLRRVYLEKVPTVVIDEVVINDNTSVLNNDILSHRIGMCPFLTDPESDTFNLQVNGPCVVLTQDISDHMMKNIIIVRLEKNQRLDLKLKTKKDVGARHAKWQPIEHIFYQCISSTEFKFTITDMENRDIKTLIDLGLQHI